MSNFTSRPLKNFHNFHTELNNYVKISTSSIDYLYNSSTCNTELAELINKLVLESGERWTPKLIKNPKEDLIKLRNDLTKTSIMWVYSSFDVFFNQVSGMLSESIDRNDDEEETLKSSKLLKLYEKFEWDTSEIINLIPIFVFYNHIRNCVVHNMGVPTKNIIKLRDSESFIEAIKAWKTKYPKKKISDSPSIIDDKIILNPHHAIFYSETCYRIAQDINNKIFIRLGLDFFIYRIIKKCLLDVSALRKPNCEDFNKYLIYNLKVEYNIHGVTHKDIKSYYNNLEHDESDKGYSERIRKGYNSKYNLLKGKD